MPLPWLSGGSGSTRGSTHTNSPPAHWLPDSISTRCYECQAKFGTFRRRHHCRLCGLLFCAACSPYSITMEALEGRATRGTGTQHQGTAIRTPAGDNTKKLRACRLCHEFFEKNAAEQNGQPGNSSSNRSSSETSASSSSTMGSNSTRDSHSDAQVATAAEASVWGVFDRRRGHHDSGGKKRLSNTSRETAAASSEDLLGDGEDEGTHTPQQQVGGTPAGPEWLRGLGAAELLDEVNEEEEEEEEETTDGDEDAAADEESIRVAAAVLDRRGSVASSVVPFSSEVQELVNEEVKAREESSSTGQESFSEVYDAYAEKFLRSQLKERNLPAVWSPILLSLSRQVCQGRRAAPLQLDTEDSSIKIKRLPGGSREDSHVLPGVAFSGSVVRSDMPSNATNARVLLVSGSLEHHSHRSDSRGQLLSLENLGRQEEEYVKKACTQLLVLEPDVILVEGAVCHSASELLQEAGVSLVINVKSSILHKLSDIFDIRPIDSYTSNLVALLKREGGPRQVMENSEEKDFIGVCSQFRTEQFEVQCEDDEENIQRIKSLLVVEKGRQQVDMAVGENKQQLETGGCTVLLRGESAATLSKVKAVLRNLILMRMHAICERAFLVDEYAMVSEIGDANYKTAEGKDAKEKKKQFSASVSWPVSPLLWTEIEEESAEDEEEQALEASEELMEGDEVMLRAKSPGRESDALANRFMRDPLAFIRKTDDDVLLNFRLGMDRQQPTLLKRKPCYGFSSSNNDDDSQENNDFTFRTDFPLLFSSYSPQSRAAPYYCIIPWVVTMKIYGENDLTLIDFLDTFCFSETYSCPNAKVCESPMRDHLRRFCHYSGSLMLHTHQLINPMVPSANDRDVSMWRYCGVCKLITPIVPLSEDAGAVSFAWFIALHFYERSVRRRGSTAELCKHPLHRDQAIYFSKGHHLVSFEFNTITPAPIKAPGLTIAVPPPSAPSYLGGWDNTREENRTLNVAGSQGFGRLLELIVAAEERERGLRQESDGAATMTSAWRNDHTVEFEEYRGLQRTLNLHVQDQADHEQIVRLAFKVRRLLADSARTWQKRLSLFQQEFPLLEEKERNLADLWRKTVLESEALGDAHVHFNLSVDQWFAVDEKQPSSILAYVLQTAEHRAFVESSTATSASSNAHFEIQFRSNSDKDRFYCCVHFARRFHDLRTRLLGDEADSKLISSLARCRPWVPQGGKSGLSFFKTKDDRFILKEMSKIEVNCIQTFAGNYFDYLAGAEQQGEPSVLAKIVGVFKLGFKTSSSSFSMDLLVMENLFFNRDITETFDLKGSIRNRFAKGQLVLMDENLIRVSCERPLYVAPEVKQGLLAKLERDTAFLCGQAMMDYSLLVGVERETGELVLGIIDYIRTFSWDKKIETLVKSSGFLGGGRTPTVISPKLYRNRFIDFMYKMLICVPSLGHGRDLAIAAASAAAAAEANS